VRLHLVDINGMGRIILPRRNVPHRQSMSQTSSKSRACGRGELRRTKIPKSTMVLGALGRRVQSGSTSRMLKTMLDARTSRVHTGGTTGEHFRGMLKKAALVVRER